MYKISSTSGVTLTKFALALTLAAALGACGGGGGSAPPLQVATANTTSAVTASTVAALVATPPIVSSFTIGLSGTDNTLADSPVTVVGPTTVAFTSSSATPTFAITNGGLTATGVTTFGSCIFTVDANSLFLVGHPLAPNSVVKVNPCNLNASTAGASANGAASQRDVVLVLGTSPSDPIKLAVTVNADGTVLIGTTPFGTVTLTAATGATGAGS